MFRRVALENAFPGKLWLHSMPGLYEDLGSFLAEAARIKVDRVVCLTPRDECERASPRYAALIASGKTPFEHTRFPIPDHGVAADETGFFALARELGTALRSGRRLLIHCYAGIGRTGTLACCTLLSLGLEFDDARYLVHLAGASTEAPAQRRLVESFACQIHDADIP